MKNIDYTWVVTTLLAIATFIWTVIYNVKKYKADLISKTRIEWLKEIRELYGKYIEAIVGVFDGKKKKCMLLLLMLSTIS